MKKIGLVFFAITIIGNISSMFKASKILFKTKNYLFTQLQVAHFVSKLKSQKNKQNLNFIFENELRENLFDKILGNPNEKIINFLKENQFKPSDYELESHLRENIRKNHFKKAELLLKFNLDKDLNNSKSNQALFFLGCKYHNLELIKIMLNRLVDIDYKDHDGRTALMKIASYSNYVSKESRVFEQYLDIALYLIDAGANVNVQDNDGKTALMFATENKNSKLIDLLIKSGANCENKR